MTLNQLLNEVYSLGFDTPDGLCESFVFSVNRALKMIFTELAPSIRVTVSIGAADNKSIDLSKRFGDVMIITGAPTDKCGRIINGAYTDGYTVTFPDAFIGDAVIRYKPMPRAVTLDSGEEEIDIPSFASHLLPLLTASFVFLDDDEYKADYYMTLYRREALKISHATSTSYDNTFTDVTGWA